MDFRWFLVLCFIIYTLNFVMDLLYSLFIFLSFLSFYPPLLGVGGEEKEKEGTRL